MNYIIFGLNFLLLLFCCIPMSTIAQTIPLKESLKDQVGDIIYNSKTDKKNCVCYPRFIPQYYQVNTHYKGGMRSIRREFFKLTMNIEDNKRQSGIITVRFIVNCKGITDRFRVYELNSNYQPISFNEHLVNIVLRKCKELRFWIPGKLASGMPVDSYYYINFRFVHGKLIGITP